MKPNEYKTITQVSGHLNLPAHVLRFWETKFPQIQPLKRGGGRRYYDANNIALITRIRELLHYQGYTIRGVQQLLDSEKSTTYASNAWNPAITAGRGQTQAHPCVPQETHPAWQDTEQELREELASIRNDLHDLLRLLDDSEARHPSGPHSSF